MAHARATSLVLVSIALLPLAAHAAPAPAYGSPAPGPGGNRVHAGDAGAGEAAVGGREIAAWRFDRAADVALWKPNAHVRDVRVEGDALALRTEGSDPMLVLAQEIRFPATPWQRIEIRLEADRDGPADLFWSGTTEGRFGGFAPEKRTPFQVQGDGAWHTYHLTPYWHPEGRIVRLRLDLYDGARFKIGSIRVVEPELGPPAAAAAFDFRKDQQGWNAFGPVRLAHGPDGLRVSSVEGAGHAVAPPVAIQAEHCPFLHARLAARGTERATLLFATRDRPGLRRIALPLRAGPGMQTYNFDLLDAGSWEGEVIAIGVAPGDRPGATLTIERLVLGRAPQGPAQLTLGSFLVEEALPRVGRTFSLAATIGNVGGAPAASLSASLTLPDGIRIVGGPERAGPAALAPQRSTTLRWRLAAARPFTGEIAARVTAGNAPPAEARLPVVITPAPPAPRTRHVPEPAPVRGPYEVGVYYFPGWNDWSRWHPLQPFPERRPVLGWYREGDPQVADWHIKWAVEHGITFFVYDWYWDRGRRHLEHALHDGYFKARYRHLLKFCLLWANHNPPGSSSRQDCLDVTRYWIENYLRRPEYFRVAGTPAVVIFSTRRLSDDLGAANVRPTFDSMRALCREAGLPGLHLLACVSSPENAKQAAEQGYDSVTAYNWPGLGMRPGEIHRPFADLIPEYARRWREIRDAGSPPMLLPVCGGWDSRPWHGEANIVRDGRTPALFRRHLEDARRLLDDAARASGEGVHPAILVEAWNEWGEGSYIEPHQEFAFGYLDAIRDVFAAGAQPHVDLAPADVGLGPYDLPEPRTDIAAWEFDGDDGWTRTMQIADARIAQGALQGRSTGRDPAFWSPTILADAARFDGVSIRMRLTPRGGAPFDDAAQFYWRVERLPERAAASVTFPARADGEWHEHTLALGQCAHWRRTVTALRIDPCNRGDVDVSIDWVRLLPARSTAPSAP